MLFVYLFDLYLFGFVCFSSSWVLGRPRNSLDFSLTFFFCIICLIWCYFVLVFFSLFSIAITLLGVKRDNLCAFRTFDRFVLVWICRFPLSLLMSGKGCGV